MQTGTVKFYNRDKAYGFITPNDGSKDVFVHKNGLANGCTIHDGDNVEFNVENTPKGLNAVDVSLIED